MAQTAAEKALVAASAKHAQLEKELNSLAEQRRLLETQLTENKMVQEELALLKEDEQVFKLVGPTLLKQDADEVKQNVEHRVDHIKKAIDTVEDAVKRNQEQMEASRKSLAELRTKLHSSG